MTTSAVGSTGTSANSTPASSSGTSASGLNLTASDFMNMMVKQLQNQDPLNPSNSDQLMAQMSAIGQMQSSTQLQTTLQGLTQQTQIGAASNLIGKAVGGTDSNKNAVSGIVTSVQVAGTNVNLALDSGGTLPLANVTSITPVATAGA